MIERLACHLTDLEIKLAGPDTDEMTFTGYGAVFGNVDAYGDVIAPGAFAETLAEARKSGIWPAMLSQHGGIGLTAEDMTPVGVWVDLAEDGKGLKVHGKLAPTPRGRELHELMKMKPRAAINGLSIGYIPKKWTPRTKPEEPRRTLQAVKLIEISPVTFPANGKARVQSVKSIEEISSLSEAERFLRDAGGLSRSEALAFVSRVKCLGQSDSDGGDLGAVAEALRRNISTLNRKEHQ